MNKSNQALLVIDGGNVLIEWARLQSPVANVK